MKKRNNGRNSAPTVSRDNWPDTLADLGLALIEDYHRLRRNEISVAQARVASSLAEQALRSVHLQFQGLKYLNEQAKVIESK